MSKRHIFLFVGVILIVASILFFLIPFLVTNKAWGWAYGEETGVIGDTIGGIVGPTVGFIGIILTFLAFYIQFQANQVQIKGLAEQIKSSERQERQILLQQFENNFFELLKLHRENVSELNYRNNSGRNVIIKVINEFYEILEILMKKDFISEYKLDEQDVANIAYTILFFGVDETVEDVLLNRFFKKYYNIETSIWDLVNELRKKENPYNSDKYYFNGHQSRLGHYFRHLRRTITYVHRSSLLLGSEKKNYIRILRAQLSNHEQILLFFNSISDLGLKWELESQNNEALITTYSLIRNIPLGAIYGYKPNRYYPNLKMENNFEVEP